MATKRKRLPIEDKYAIIQKIDAGVSRKAVIKEYGLNSQSNVTLIMSNRKQIEEEMQTGVKGKTKTVRKSMYPMIDEDLRDFVADMNSRGGAVSHSILKQKALDFAVNHGVHDRFMASDGYLQKFMKRQSVANVSSHGEAANVDQAIIQNWIETLPSLIKDRDRRDVFNCDELGLFFKLTPSRSYAIKGNNFRTGKNSKERVTLLLAANMAGNEKLPPLMIGKSQNPRCFNKIKRKPVMYRWNRKAWMTSVVFEEWLSRLNGKMKGEKRKIVMFMDNCSAHPHNLIFSNITIMRLPANTTSVLQPMDQGIIKCFKSYYRKRLVRYIISELEIDKAKRIEDVKIDLLLSSKWAKSAWNDVTEATIRNCFKKAGFVRGDQEQEPDVGEDLSLEIPDIGAISMNEFISADDGLSVSGSCNEQAAVGEEEERGDSDPENEQEDDVVALIEPTNREARQALKTLQTFMLFKNNDEQEKPFDRIEEFISKCNRDSMIQTSITDYFVPKQQ